MRSSAPSPRASCRCARWASTRRCTGCSCSTASRASAFSTRARSLTRSCAWRSASRYPAGSPEVEFFTEHAEADVGHSQRQATLCAKYLDSDAAKARALEVAEQACMLRWASITDLYRREYLGEKEILPSGVD